jgi:hypothetical protein
MWKDLEGGSWGEMRKAEKRSFFSKLPKIALLAIGAVIIIIVCFALWGVAQ